MPRDYGDLSSFDFECLVRDLFSAMWDTRLEVFAPGRDKGIDVRLLRPGGNHVYIQCKHSPYKSFADIKSSLKKEAAKVSPHIDGEYWLVTSAQLTAANKAEICELFGRNLLDETRILWRADLDDLLESFPEVERKNYKLYMSSMGVLQRILRSSTFFRTEATLRDLKRKVRLFVQTPAFDEALAKLTASKSCIISGEPGVGKTTLAEMLLMHLVEQGYECIPVSRDIEEAEELFLPNAKQVFYYDDFLGQTSLSEKLNKNEDGRLLSFMRRLEDGANHLLILTTREYLLRQARQTYERLNRREIELRKFILDLKNYNRLHRAHILYNHLYYSKLPAEAISSLLAGKQYQVLIDHRNYNPRLIEFLITLAEHHWSEDPETSFAQYALASLEDPSELWRRTYEDQLSETAQELLLVLASFSGTAEMGALRSAITNYQLTTRGRAESQLRISKAIDETEGVFTTSEADTNSYVYVEFGNPSFRDYMAIHIRRNPEVISSLIESLCYFEQLRALYAWGWNNSRTGISPTSVGKALQPHLPAITRKALDLFTAAPLKEKGSIYSPLIDDAYHKKATADRLILLLTLISLGKVDISDDERDRVLTDVFEAWDSTGFRFSWKGAAVRAVELITAHRPLTRFNALVERLAPMLERDLKEPEDFGHLYDFRQAVGREDAGEVVRMFQDFVPSYVESVLLGDPDSYERSYEDLDRIADDFGLDIMSEIEELGGAAEEHKEYERRHGGDHSPYQGTLKDRLSEIRIDMEVDHLFDTFDRD